MAKKTTLISDPIITADLAAKINKRVRELPWSSEERAELARATGTSLRQVQAWFAPADAKVQRPLIPEFVVDHLARGNSLGSLPSHMLARIETGIASLPRAGLDAIGVLRQTPDAYRGGYWHVYEGERLATLPQALDRARQYQNRGEGVDVYIRNYWRKIEIVPSEDGGWSLLIEYRAGVISPPAMRQEDHDEDEADDSYDDF